LVEYDVLKMKVLICGWIFKNSPTCQVDTEKHYLWKLQENCLHQKAASTFVGLCVALVYYGDVILQ
jgi:hypothetical protein